VQGNETGSTIHTHEDITIALGSDLKGAEEVDLDTAEREPQGGGVSLGGHIETLILGELTGGARAKEGLDVIGIAWPCHAAVEEGDGASSTKVARHGAVHRAEDLAEKVLWGLVLQVNGAQRGQLVRKLLQEGAKGLREVGRKGVGLERRRRGKRGAGCGEQRGRLRGWSCCSRGARVRTLGRRLNSRRHCGWGWGWWCGRRGSLPRGRRAAGRKGGRGSRGRRPNGGWLAGPGGGTPARRGGRGGHGLRRDRGHQGGRGR
jgi:hypothetical protein